jgi:hypothetical protein
VATLRTVKGTEVVCSSEHGGGSYTGARTVGGVTLALGGCEALGSKCSSLGAQAGEVVTNSLQGTLGVEAVGTTAAKNKLALDLAPSVEGEPVIAFSCGAAQLSVRGSVIVPTTADKMLTTEAIKFVATSGRQKPENLVELPRDVLEMSVNEAAFEQAGLSAALTQVGEEAVEANSAL